MVIIGVSYSGGFGFESRLPSKAILTEVLFVILHNPCMEIWGKYTLLRTMDVVLHTVFVGREMSGGTVRCTCSPTLLPTPQDIYSDRQHFQTQNVLALPFDLIIQVNKYLAQGQKTKNNVTQGLLGSFFAHARLIRGYRLFYLI
jgi:hypothetical protein